MAGLGYDSFFLLFALRYLWPNTLLCTQPCHGVELFSREWEPFCCKQLPLLSLFWQESSSCNLRSYQFQESVECTGLSSPIPIMVWEPDTKAYWVLLDEKNDFKMSEACELCAKSCLRQKEKQGSRKPPSVQPWRKYVNISCTQPLIIWSPCWQSSSLAADWRIIGLQ